MRPVLVLALALCLATPALAQTRARDTVGAAEKMEPAAADLLAKMQAAQKSTKVMTASFKQVKEDALFAEPSVQSGDFAFQSPSLFRWDYKEPERVIVQITKDTFQRYLPDQKLARRMDLSKNRRRVFNYFGIGSDVEVLKQHFDFHAAGLDSALPGTRKLELRGKRRRVQKRMELLEMWLDEKTWLPAAIKVSMADGSTTFWQFTNIAVNQELPASTFDLRVPAGTIIQSEDDPNSPIIDELVEEETASTAPSKGAGN